MSHDQILDIGDLKDQYCHRVCLDSQDPKNAGYNTRKNLKIIQHSNRNNFNVSLTILQNVSSHLTHSHSMNFIVHNH